MFEAFKMKEWAARRMPVLKEAVARDPADKDAVHALRMIRAILEAVVVRVEFPERVLTHEDWTELTGRAMDHGLPIPFDNTVMEIPTKKIYGDQISKADGYLVHFCDALRPKGYPVLTKPSYRHISVSQYFERGPWSMFPFVAGDIGLEDDYISVTLVHQPSAGVGTNMAPDDPRVKSLVSLIFAAQGYVLSCRAEPAPISMARQVAMGVARHRPKRDEYRVAVIDPEKLKAYEKKAPIGTHASPIPHDRRGHLRRYKSGKEVWIRDQKVRGGAQAREGFLVKDYLIKGTDTHTS